MTVLVFGATGTLGLALRRAASTRNITITGAARGGADVDIDITDARALEAFIRAQRPRVIINCAAITDLDACERDPEAARLCNAQAPGIMAKVAGELGAKFAQVSTDHFFTNDRSQKHDEMFPVVLVNEYARTKYAGEEATLAVPGTLVLRTNFTGWRGWAGRPTFVEWATNALLKDDAPLTGFSDFFTSTVDADTLANAIFDLIARDASGRLNLAARDVADKATFLRSLAVQLDIPTSRISEGTVRCLKTPRASSLGLDVSRAEQILGYRLPDLAAVVAALVQSRPGGPCAS